MIDSPCNDVCTTDSESGLCVGCGRTTNEIAKWFKAASLFCIISKRKPTISKAGKSKKLKLV